VLADYGCSEGRDSLAPVRAAVDALRARHGDGLQIVVLHTDLPGNDYSSLFGTVAHDPHSYRRTGAGVDSGGSALGSPGPPSARCRARSFGGGLKIVSAKVRVVGDVAVILIPPAAAVPDAGRPQLRWSVSVAVDSLW